MSTSSLWSLIGTETIDTATIAQDFQLERAKEVGTALSVDFVAGFAASLLVSPAVAIIDKAIITNASGKESFNEGLKNMTKLLITRPHQFIRQPYFFPVFCIFGGTYAVANSIDTICYHSNIRPTLPKFAASSVVNIALNGWKDSLFTRWYGTVKPRPLPALSLGLFAVRDSITVATAFLAPPLISPYLQDLGLSKHTADVAAQITAPCAVQFVSTNIHLYALDLYNHPGLSWAEHSALIRKNYWTSSVGRVIRTLPGFGIGGVANMRFRNGLKEVVEGKLF
ncbi:hypothetical protein HDU79_005902 [Rhizoclosmatium sp. JEL0117]|nr:hypothetical protein HDU79_005902 [Rhizoclosmatium sp. JEL0117]